MTRSHQLVALFLIAGTALPAWSQSQNNTKDKRDPPPMGYSGGGIRGAVASVPDGWLVDAAEARDFQGEAGFNEPAPLRPRAVMPAIDIMQPEPASGVKVKAPFAISVQFRALPGSAIVPGSFKVLYGARKVDITERLTKFGQVTPQGFSIETARLPVGKHRLTLQVQDDKQRVAERELRVEVE